MGGPYVALGGLLVEGGAVLHEDGADDVGAMEADLDVILVVEAHVGEDGQHGAHQRGAVAAGGQQLQHDRDEAQVPQLHQDVEVVRGTRHGRERLDAAQDGLLY